MGSFVCSSDFSLPQARTQKGLTKPRNEPTAVGSFFQAGESKSIVEPLLSTKFYIPPTRSKIVTRPRLIERLNAGLHHKLTLISAPAGFGKTTLVSEWVGELLTDVENGKGTTNRVAWLSLDEGDNDTNRFLIYTIAALQSAEAGLAEGTLQSLQSPHPPRTETVLIALINAISLIPDPFILIFDDYQVIETPEVHDALAFLLEHLPPRLHIVLVSRVDPQLPLSRLRARDQLTELRASDLRFTATEAADFLNRSMGLTLTGEDIQALEERTEGWIAGLQLAAISLRGQVNTSRLIQAFTGSHRLVLDYLIEEVLDRQPEVIQNFLLRTAILDRLTGALCDAVTCQENSRETLEILERSNMFIVPLDHERNWYRYHQLFADLLRQRLHQKSGEDVRNLNVRASEWYQEKGMWSEAIRHAFAAEDLERAASLIEQSWRPLNMNYRSVTWLGWAKALPDEMVCSNPTLSAAYGWALLDTGDLIGAELCFRDAERWLETNEQPELSPDHNRRRGTLDEEELRSLSVSIANGRAYLAQATGDATSTLKYAQQAAKLLREDEYFERGLSDVLMGFAYWASGDLESAEQAIADSIAKMQAIGKVQFVISFTSYLVDILTAQGRLHEAERVLLQMLDTVTEQGNRDVRETAVLHLGLSELYLEWGDREAAKWHLQRSEDLGQQPTIPPWYRHWICANIKLVAAQGNLDSAVEVLNGAEGLYYRHPIPDVRPLAAVMARMWLAKGKLAEVQRWAREQGLSVEDDLSYLREFEHTTLARLLIAQYKNEPVNGSISGAMRLVERLLKAAERGRRIGSVIEILVLQALTYEVQNDIPSALLSLERALTLAEPESYLQTFVGEGAPMAHLLYEALDHQIVPAYVQRLLKIILVEEPDQTKGPQTQTPEQKLIEPLSDREIEILQLIAEGLTNQEIAAQLYLSLNTVKVHTRNIYGKLEVNSRTQAASRARTLGILADS